MNSKNVFECIDKLEHENRLEKHEWKNVINGRTKETTEYLFKKSRAVCDRVYGKEIFIRGLIEFTNFCRNDCYYCGIRKSNKNAERYRLTKEEILSCCEEGYKTGFRTFVLQGGEDAAFTTDKIADIVRSIKTHHKDCAVTLSIGECSEASYKAFKEAGADRYLLRHETANECHYKVLHPGEMSLENRKKCLWNLKKLGFQTGAGIMAGSPGQTADCLAEDFEFLTELQPEMVGIGPFIPHKDTPFNSCNAGDTALTLYLLGLTRLLLPNVLLPATTALGTVLENGREKGILAGANVVMPNLSPASVREKYLLYNNKICTGKEAAECLDELNKSIMAIGYKIAFNRGDYKNNCCKTAKSEGKEISDPR